MLFVTFGGIRKPLRHVGDTAGFQERLAIPDPRFQKIRTILNHLCQRIHRIDPAIGIGQVTEIAKLAIRFLRRELDRGFAKRIGRGRLAHVNRVHQIGGAKIPHPDHPIRPARRFPPSALRVVNVHQQSDRGCSRGKFFEQAFQLHLSFGQISSLGQPLRQLPRSCWACFRIIGIDFGHHLHGTGHVVPLRHNASRKKYSGGRLRTLHDQVLGQVPSCIRLIGLKQLLSLR